MASICSVSRIESASRRLRSASSRALDVYLLEVLQQLAALAYQAQQGALGAEIVAVVLEVFSKVVDTVGKQRDLALGRTRVGVRLAVLAEKLLLFFCC